MHIILGAGGPVANALTRQLIDNHQPVTLVSRRPSKFSGNNVKWLKVDLLNAAEVLAATQGATVIYLCAGLVYDKDVWKQQWPVIMQNVINAAKQSNARLIFFDNVYMYGLVNGRMTEDTPYNPISVKGEVRAKTVITLMDEVNAGNLNASILRGADFYGAESMNSFFDMMVLDKYAKGDKAQWIGDARTRHTFTYVPDAGKAMYLLGQSPESDNQIWHAPSAPAITGKQFIELAADVFGVEPRYGQINKFMLWMAGLFNKVIMGTVEMYYQYDHDYVFDSTKFEKAFNVRPTSYRNGIQHLAQTQFKR